jgi:hypothetical protein
MRSVFLRAVLLICSVNAPALAEPMPAPPSPSARLGPSVRDVVRMALKAARHTDPARVELLVRRARLAGLMPSLKVAAERGLKQDLSSSSTSEAERLAAAVADDFSFEASLTFDLPRLVFAPEEVRLLSVQRWLAGDQRKLVEEVVRLYFKRRKLIEIPPGSGDEAVERALAIAEIEAVLDAITDGAYGRALARSAR